MSTSDWWRQYAPQQRVSARHSEKDPWERGTVMYARCDAQVKRIAVRTHIQDCMTGEYYIITVTDPANIKPT
jgi:hypothetical protein